MPSATAARPSASSSPPASAEAARVVSTDWRSGGFAVYVHWPFCAAKCPYCDFNSHVRASVDRDRWRRALTAELRRCAAETPGRRVASVFFGGGTPSLMPAATVAAAIETVAECWDLADDAEITLEANPTSVEAARFAGYAAAGVNRLSLGVQALDDPDLRRLGRLHTAAEALAAFDLARRTFPRVSIDLIYAREGQSQDAWEAELRRALALGADHLSLYQLTIEPGTRFHALQARGGLPGLPGADLAAAQWEATQAICGASGMPGYEVSNHAAAGAEGRHNCVYWRYGDYVGVGPGAHGRLTVAGGRFATEAIRAPEVWLAAVEARGEGEAARTPLSHDDQAAEMLIMGMRLREGVDLARLARLAGRALPEAVVGELAGMGLVRSEAGRLRTTASGRVLLDALLRRLLAAL
jgi:putative oxygen-independent coproporphyrinogen III oxidase